MQLLLTGQFLITFSSGKTKTKKAFAMTSHATQLCLHAVVFYYLLKKELREIWPTNVWEIMIIIFYLEYGRCIFHVAWLLYYACYITKTFKYMHIQELTVFTHSACFACWLLLFYTAVTKVTKEVAMVSQPHFYSAVTTSQMGLFEVDHVSL